MTALQARLVLKLLMAAQVMISSQAAAETIRFLAVQVMTSSRVAAELTSLMAVQVTIQIHLKVSDLVSLRQSMQTEQVQPNMAWSLSPSQELRT